MKMRLSFFQHPIIALKKTSLFLACGAAAYYGWKSLDKHMQQTSSETVNVVVAAKVVDLGGRPLAGARVTHPGSDFGMTDSFGEWRKSVHLRVGQEINVRAEKKFRGEVFAAAKTFRISEDMQGQELKVMMVLSVSQEIQNEPTPVGVPQTRPRVASLTDRKIPHEKTRSR